MSWNKRNNRNNTHGATIKMNTHLYVHATITLGNSRQ